MKSFVYLLGFNIPGSTEYIYPKLQLEAFQHINFLRGQFNKNFDSAYSALESLQLEGLSAHTEELCGAPIIVDSTNNTMESVLLSIVDMTQNLSKLNTGFLFKYRCV